ncbi:hypothetical protein [Nocardioides sp. NPDC047086]|uniref:hypothetical protein n=1 Tax=Nocardioides sp. NPDC047086 TaxID=3154810 RepID=UPI0033ECA74C
MSAPLDYEVRLATHLDEHWATSLGCSVPVHEPDGTTTLRCRVQDQSELHGLLGRIRDLGVDLISVRRDDRHI